MSRVWKLGMLALVITTMVWLTTLWRWQSAAIDVGQKDIVLHLLVLPLALLLALWLALRLGAQVRRQLLAPAMVTPAQVPARTTGLEQSAQPSTQAASPWDVVLLGSELCLMPGVCATEVAQQVRERKVWPCLDAVLNDHQGLPVFTARVPDLDPGEDDLKGQEPMEQRDDAEHRKRALQLMARVWQPLAERIVATSGQAAWRAFAPHGEPLDADDERRGGKVHPERLATPAHLAGVAREGRHRREAARPRMTVAVAWPEDMPQAWQTQCLSQVQRTWSAVLDEAQASTPWQMAWVVWAEPSPLALWARIDQALRAWSGEPDAPATSLVVLVADSALDEACIDQWQGRGELFTAQHQQGRVPGEGAVALWWSRPDWPGAGTEALAAVRVRLPAVQARERSADVPGRVGSQALRSCIADAMAVQDLKAPGPLDWQIFSDADHRASRTAELFEALTDVAPELDPMRAVHRLGDVCGDLGLCAGLAPLALAEGVVRDQCAAGNTSSEAAAALVVSVQSPIHRMAMALVPEPVKQT